MIKIIGLTIASGLFATSAAAISPPSGAPILMDGRCETSEWADAALVSSTQGHTLRIKKSDRYLMMCITYPEDGRGTFEGYLVTDKQKTPLNIHVSAKVGDREWSPSGWPEFEWWAAEGWWSNPVRFNSAEEEETRFLPSPAREVQFDLDHFGRDGWRIMFDVYYGRRDDGTYDTVALPADADFEDQESWISLDF